MTSTKHKYSKMSLCVNRLTLAGAIYSVEDGDDFHTKSFLRAL